MKKWISICNKRPSATGATSVWSVKKGQITLGKIAWFSSWRKYAFFPEPNTVFEEDCLRDIADFCEQQTDIHKDRAKDSKTQIGPTDI